MKNPRQFQFPFALWTSQMIVIIIREKSEIKLSRASACRLLNQLGITAQRLLWRAYQQDPAHVERWLKEEFAEIRPLAKQENAEQQHPIRPKNRAETFRKSLRCNVSFHRLPKLPFENLSWASVFYRELAACCPIEIIQSLANTPVPVPNADGMTLLLSHKIARSREGRGAATERLAVL